jgi:hypothetical protein
MSNAPVKKFKIGLVSGTIWRNENDGKPFYTVQLARNYKDAEGNWKAGDNLNHDDLLNASRVLTRCEAWIAEQ